MSLSLKRSNKEVLKNAAPGVKTPPLKRGSTDSFESADYEPGVVETVAQTHKAHSEHIVENHVY